VGGGRRVRTLASEPVPVIWIRRLRLL